MTGNDQKKAHIIVVSNEKGGTGKSTLSMHLAVKLLQEGFKVATIDLDGRQGTLSKYVENRINFCMSHNIDLPIPEHFRFSLEPNHYLIPAAREKVAFQIYELSNQVDAIIIDTPGTKNYLFEEAHKHADTLITPISDSMIDVSVIADIDYAKEKITNPGPYAEYVWETKKCLAGQTLSELDCRRQQIVQYQFPQQKSGFHLSQKNCPHVRLSLFGGNERPDDIQRTFLGRADRIRYVPSAAPAENEYVSSCRQARDSHACRIYLPGINFRHYPSA